MLLSIIIVSYNTKELTLQTIESVLQDIERSLLLQKQTEIFVVDNHSQDDSPAAIRQYTKQHGFIHLIENTQNVGFAKANNQAIEKASGKYVLLLNSDTVVQAHALEKLVKAMEATPIDDTTSALSTESDKLDRLGVVAATLHNPDGSLQAQGGSFPGLISLIGHMWMLDDLPIIGRFFPSTQHTGMNAIELHTVNEKKQLQQKDWVGGTAMLVRRAVFEEVGVLDHNIFMYGEDVEFCMRACHHQWDVAIHPTAIVTHLGSASSSSVNAILGELKGYLYIWAKHKPLWQSKYVRWIIKVGCYLRIFLFSYLMKKPERAAVYRKALEEIFE